MKQDSYIILILALLITLSVNANEMTDTQTAPESKYQPTAEQMIIDGLIYRPLSLVSTLLGAGLFIVTLPFSLIGGNAGQAGERLVLDPASATFDRCLGCLPGNSSSGYSQ